MIGRFPLTRHLSIFGLFKGNLPPPFESVAEKRWVKENKASPYTLAEKLPVNLILAPGIADR